MFPVHSSPRVGPGYREESCLFSYAPTRRGTDEEPLCDFPDKVASFYSALETVTVHSCLINITARLTWVCR